MIKSRKLFGCVTTSVESEIDLIRLGIALPGGRGGTIFGRETGAFGVTPAAEVACNAVTVESDTTLGRGGRRSYLRATSFLLGGVVFAGRLADVESQTNHM